MTTTPGFSSRDTTAHVKQLPQRDEALMIENHEPGWSNTAPDSSQRVTSAAPAAEPVEAEAKVVEPAVSESKTVKKAPAKRASK